ncbi:MAG: Uncharacterised protein [Glaciecola sp. HTCC2999]|nr:MAG: Uncharacterised protein [Glaciecola sp. HTCC2999]
MQLIQVNKSRYRKHLNILIVGCITVLISGSLGVSQWLILLYPDPSGSHFQWNLTGVIVSSIVIGFSLWLSRKHPFMNEVFYVWKLKQALNRITRSMAKIKTAAERGDYNALLALQFNYDGSRLLWDLDDNTLMMEELNLEQTKLDAMLTQYGLNVDVVDYSFDTLDKISK